MEQSNNELNNNTTYKNKGKFANTLRDNMEKIMVFLLAIAYTSYGLFELSRKKESIVVIIGNILLGLVFGVMITRNMRKSGLKDGRKSELFQNSLSFYATSKTNATKWFDKLPLWCSYKNRQELEIKKKNIILSAGLNWKGYIYGYYDIHKENLSEEQLNALDQAKKTKIQPLTYEDLLSDLPNGYSSSGKRWGASEEDYINKASISDILSRVLTAIVGGLFTLSPLINGSNYQEVIASCLWNAGQIVVWISFGFIKYGDSKYFMEYEYRQTHIIQKTEYLNEFVVTMENNPEVITNLEEDIEINNYIEEFIFKQNKVNELKREMIEAKEKERDGNKQC